LDALFNNLDSKTDDDKYERHFQKELEQRTLSFDSSIINIKKDCKNSIEKLTKKLKEVEHDNSVIRSDNNLKESAIMNLQSEHSNIQKLLKQSEETRVMLEKKVEDLSLLKEQAEMQISNLSEDCSKLNKVLVEKESY